MLSMSMDDEWRKVYDERAERDVPEFMKGCWSLKGYEQLLRVTLSLIKEVDDGKMKSVLDVGCGAGRYCHELSKDGYDVLGVDYSEKLVAHAREKFPKLKFAVENGYSLSFKDKGFDLVISIGALQCLADYEQFLKEICRVSKRFVIVSTLKSRSKKDLDADLNEMLKEDPWPTRDYHPEHLTELFESWGFKTRVVTREKGIRIRDGFFVVAERRN
ncbi:methyltransferase domain-containing protein [Candidatus Woesearchaeota archaeon]|nr:methyltransferase domain-containing protein [Candidatus Woesearchaeota archaeon]